MGNSQGIQAKIIDAVSQNEVRKLRELFSQVRASDPQNANTRAILDMRLPTGNTLLMLAASKCHKAVAEYLLDLGADVNAVNIRQGAVAFTALHIAVHHKFYSLVQLLIDKGADPFLASPHGLTSVELAVVSKVAPILRLLESKALFHGVLGVKTKQFLSSGFKHRYVVVMPYRMYELDRPIQAHTILLIYKNTQSIEPQTKCRIDQATLRRINDKACLILDPEHGKPSNVATSFENGYIVNFQSADTATQSQDAFNNFVNTLANRLPPGHFELVQPPGPLVSGAAQLRPTIAAPQGGPPLQVGPPGPGPGYPPIQQLPYPPGPGPMPPQGQPAGYPGPAPYPGYYDAPGAPASQGPLPQQGPAYPAPYPVALPPGFPGPYPGPQTQGNDGRQGPSAGPPGPVDVHRGGFYPVVPSLNAEAWGGPPESAASTSRAPTPSSGASSPTFKRGPSAPPLDPDVPAFSVDNAQDCVICLSAPREAGFLHGSTVHCCVCRDCMKALHPGQPCPLCRAPIERVILLF